MYDSPLWAVFTLSAHYRDRANAALSAHSRSKALVREKRERRERREKSKNIYRPQMNANER